MKTNEIPLLDNFYDDVPYLTPEIIIGAGGLHDDIIELVKKHKVTTAVITWLLSENLDTNNLSNLEYIGDGGFGKFYLWEKKILFSIITIGAPVAVAVAEILRAYGIKNIVAFGTAGAINGEIDTKKVVVVERAIRDEGASHHYLPADMYVELQKEFSDKLSKFFDEKSLANVKGTTWTTDAFFRETKNRIKKRISQGAIAVEMECSALASVCKFYSLNFCQFLFFSDAVEQKCWKKIGTKEERQNIYSKFLSLALEFAKSV